MAQGADESPEYPLEGFEEARPTDRSKRLRVVLIVATIVLVFAAIYVAVQASFADKVPGGTSISGIDVSGMTQDEATAAVSEGLASRVTAPVQLVAADSRAEIDPQTAGLSIDPERTTSGLTGFTLSPARLIEHLGGGKQLDVHTSIDRGALREAVETVAEDLSTAAADGFVTIVDGQPIATAAQDGVDVDIDGSVDAVVENWMRTTEPIEVPVVTAAPVVTQEATDAAVQQAQTIVSAPVWVEIDGQRAEIPEDVIGTALTYQTSAGQLVPELDADVMRQAVIDRTTKLEREPKDAFFAFNKKNKPKIRGGQTGQVLEGTAVAEQVLAAAQTEDRTAQVALTESDPEVTKADLKALGIKEVVAEFSTPLTSEPIRTINIRNAGEKLTGYLVKPGDTFSLEKAIGPVTVENGYKEAGVVVNGFHTKGVGGGLSQVATTTYNVGFFAGMVDVEHRPHTEWFSRYPEGREATIFTGSLDMKWRNDSPHGVLLRSWVANGRYYVQAWSTKFYEVETTTSPRSNVRAPTTVYTKAQGCVPSGAGNSGFTVTVSRKVTEIESGKVAIDEKNTWTYRPTNAIRCGDKPKPSDDDE
ncbi:Vancomycin resistance protein YoaR, contains peptidoglycan-binding and VanW domains [Micrococcales bacterium KH10]|nr:Vancomycin resistance protein YoaR, contains peptidoglycan-binding and VanW domains [Micrococcales bacterium KH10]